MKNFKSDKWEIMDPNGKGGYRYRPIRIGPKTNTWEEGLYIGDAAKDKNVIPLAKFLIFCVNIILMIRKKKN